MKFCEKLTELRREKGYSQEQLAFRLNVSRQAVSRWEAGLSMPELSKILQLSEIFMVTTDYLLKETVTERQPAGDAAKEGFCEFGETQARILEKLDQLDQMEKRERTGVKEYEYISPGRLFGLPLVHIHFKWTKGYRQGFGSGVQAPGIYADFKTKAKGIIAIGNNATGILSIGFLAKGLFSIGLFSIGFFSAGIMSLAFLSLGIIAAGLAAGGVVSIGYAAIGVSAVGIYASGVAALAGKAATGVAAVARTAAGSGDADGTYAMLVNELSTRQDVAAFLTAHQPDIPKWVLFLLTVAF